MQNNGLLQNMFEVSTTSARSLLVKLSTALLIEFCGNSSQIDYRASVGQY